MNKKIISILSICLLIMVMCVACSNKKDKVNNGASDKGEGTQSSEKTYSDEEQAQIFEQLFDINNKIEIDIDITDEQLNLLQEDYFRYSQMGSKSPIYRDTAMSITITTDEGATTYEFDKVGIRMKGNTSRTDFYNSKDGLYNLIHFKIKFPEPFALLEKLDIRWNRQDDSTYIREYYSYEFMRECGILAPHSNLASVDVAGVHEGVFSICEPVDKLFIERNLPKEDWDGDLYKCGWDEQGVKYTLDMTIGIEDEETGEFYNYDLKNNKKTSNHELLNNLLTELNDGDVTKDELAELIDMEYFVKFAAASYFLGNPDDIRYNYNNHYIYFLKSSNKAIFIPCDNDRCLGLTRDWNPTGDGMVSVNPFSTLADGACSKQENPLFIYTVDAGGYYIDEYAKALNQVAESEWLTADKFDSIYNLAYDNYKDDATPDKKFNNAGWHNFKFDNNRSDGLGSTFGNASFEDYIEAKMSYFKQYMTDISIYYDYVDMGGGNWGNNGNEGNNNPGNNKPGNNNQGANGIGRGYSIRGGFNNWALEDKYIMTYDSETNTYSYTIQIIGEQWLKIASNDGFEWYGYDNIVGDIDKSLVTYDDDHHNIILQSGTYRIVLNGSNNTIEIEVQ